ncbi:hypothetical protein [Paenibacillus sp. FSL H8-0537]|uniref:hypothetical protein n=1 Tax=Paenibacillus sp. FSL H8-0537 TaxID=2921399 RepID=UPI0031012B74
MIVAKTAVAEPMWLSGIAETVQLQTIPPFWRTENPLFSLLTRFLTISGQEIRYRAHHPGNLAKGSALAAPESATCAFPVTLLI